MPDSTLDRAAAILRSGGRIAMTTAELAAALADAAALGDPAAPPAATAVRHTADPVTVAVLERRLADDDRFLVFDTGLELPGIEAWDPGDRLAYAAALRQVDLPRPPLVLVRDARDPSAQPGSLDARAQPGPLEAPDPATAPTPATSLSRLLRHTVIALAATRSGPLIALAAEEARAALVRVNLWLPGAGPSTSPPPGPPPPA